MKLRIVVFIVVGLFSCINGISQKKLEFNSKKFQSLETEFQGQLIKVRAYENLVYVSKPLDSSIQKINIYIPEAYFSGKSIGSFTAKTAPIFFPNRVGGYMPAQPATFLVPEQKGPFPYSNKTVLTALSKGYIVASAGARGRVSVGSKGEFIGKAPAGIVDLKAAIRFLKFNDKRMFGDANKIICNGTSAGGAMSSLLGASANHPDFEPYLQEIGAAKASDLPFAVSSYCPIINLENADMAYEWQLNKIHTYNFRAKEGVLDSDAIILSNELKQAFPAYVNKLQLKNSKGEQLLLDTNGEGNFKDLVLEYLKMSAQKALDSGTDLSSYPFIGLPGKNVVSIDFDGYMLYLNRMKTPPAFDALDNKSFENNLFGTSSIENLHFTDYSFSHRKNQQAGMAASKIVGMMNPMHYLDDTKANCAPNWRIRHGAKDKDTGFAISIILATKLQNNSIKVDFELPWNVPHSGDYDLDELFLWADNICK